MSSLKRLGERIAEAQDEALRRDDLVARVRGELLARAAAGPPAPRRLGLKIGVPIAAGLAAVAAALLLFAGPGPLTVEVGPARSALAVGAWVAAPDDAAVRLHFSDGSKVTLDPGAGARVVETTTNGARVLLERGVADVDVKHRQTTSWKVDSGPYTVNVTGTRFAVAWDPDREYLEVTLAEGAVIVRGPMVAAGQRIGTGETFRAWVGEERVEIARGNERRTAAASRAAATGSEPVSEVPEELPQAPAQAPSPAADRAPVDTAGGAAPEPETAPRETAPDPPSWRELARRGEFQAAMATAESAGFDDVVARASAADLIALGDAARLNRNYPRADQAYRAARDRFPGSPQAGAAAFAIGRMAFDQQHLYAKSARWLETFLGEKPSGGLAREALGRLIEARQRAGDILGSREAARTYLERYPSGPHAAFARSVADPEPSPATVD